MAYLRVKNWSEFQHYKDRNPPWIKLHRTLLDDYEFSCLQDASKAHLMLIWLFASQRNGVIPNDPAFLKKKLGLEKEPNLNALIDQGLLIPEHSASEALAGCERVAPREESYKPVEKSNARKGSRLPDGWSPSEILKAWAAKERPDLDLAVTTARFKDYYVAAPGAKGVKLDWEATFRNWVRNERAGQRAKSDSPLYRREGPM